MARLLPGAWHGDRFAPGGRMIAGLKRLAAGGFFHIVGAGSVNKVLVALLGIVLVRVIPQDEYGVYAYAQTVMSGVLILNGLGAPSAIIQLCSERDDEAGEMLYRYGFTFGCAFDAAAAAVAIPAGLLASFPIEGSGPLFSLLGMYPFLSLVVELRQCKLRCELRNRKYAFMINVQTVLNVVLSVAGAALSGAVGLVVGQYLALLLTIAVFAWRVPGYFGLGRLPRIPRRSKLDYWRIALVSALNNGLSQALSLLCGFLVGFLLANEVDMALYKAASMIPYALAFVPGVVAVYVYPLFVRGRFDRAWTARAFAKWTVALCAVMGSVCIVGAAFAEPIISLVFGGDYAGAADAFRVLLCGSFAVNGFGRLAGNLLVTQRKLAVNTAIAVACIGVDVALSMWLIPSMGVTGAAWSWTGTMIVMAVLTFGAYVLVVRRIKPNGASNG